MTTTTPPMVTVPEMARRYAALCYAQALTRPDDPRRLYYDLGDEGRGQYETIVAVIAGYDDPAAIERVRDALADIAVASTKLAADDHRIMVLRAAAKARTGKDKRATEAHVRKRRDMRTEHLGAQARAIDALLRVYAAAGEDRKARS